MNNPHYTVEELEKLALFEEEERVRQEDPHLSACAVCGDRYRFLKRFHGRQRQGLQQERHPTPAAVIDTPAADRQLVLSPCRRSTEQTNTLPDGGLLLHAAETVAETEDRYTNVATFALASTGVLARVVRDRETDIYRISVLSTNPDHRRFVLVGVGGPEGQTPLTATDGDGIATIRLKKSPDWNIMYVVVITPSLILPLADGLPSSGSVSCGSVSVATRSAATGVQVTLLTHPMERIGHVLALLGDGSSTLHDVTENNAVIEQEVARRVIELRFFL